MQPQIIKSKKPIKKQINAVKKNILMWEWLAKNPDKGKTLCSEAEQP